MDAHLRAAVLLAAALESGGVPTNEGHDAVEVALDHTLDAALGPQDATEIMAAWRDGTSLAEMVGALPPRVEPERPQ